MIRRILFILVVLFASGQLYAQSGAIKGRVLDSGTGEAIPFANIRVELNGNLVGGGVTDFDGNYMIKPVSAGSYTVVTSYVGYKTLQMEDVIVNNDKIRFLDLKLEISTQEVEEVVVTGYKKPLIEKDNTTSGSTVTSEEISKMAGRSAEAVAATAGGVYQEDGEVKSVRGSREGSTVYYIDGVKVRGSNNIPKSAIAEVQMLTGGLPARYGDATGGIVNITTRGASRTFFGGVEAASSQFITPYNENLVNFYLSGPLVQRTIVDSTTGQTYKEPVIGFFISGELNNTEDGIRANNGVWHATDETLAAIRENPLILNPSKGTYNYSAAYLHADAFEKDDTYRNRNNFKGNFSGKLDFQLNRNFIVTVGGRAEYNKGKAGAGNWSYENQLFNYEGNGTTDYLSWAGYARITHKFGNPSGEDQGLIKNAYYTIQGDYSRTTNSWYNEDHEDRLFNYGYIGKFESFREELYQFGLDATTGNYGLLFTGWQDTLLAFTPSDLNPDLARYTESVYEAYGQDGFNYAYEMLQAGGLINGNTPNSIYAFGSMPAVTMPGVSYNSFGNSVVDQVRFSGMTAADIGNHEFSAGFEYEKSSTSSYSVNPRGLWSIARQNVNAQIAQLNLENPYIGYIKKPDGSPFEVNGELVPNDTISYKRAYNSQAQSLFDIRLRESLGLAVDGTNIIDVDALDPEKLSIDYFSADELYNNGSSRVSHYGYDVHGNVLDRNVTFEDFFTEEEIYEFSDGTKKAFKTRPIAAFEPIYSAFWVQDKFAFNDLIFNIGLRVDNYDANQKVQKDAYLLYDAYTAGDVRGGKESQFSGDIPTTISDDAVVYVDNVNDPNKILGFREDRQWYDKTGNEINDPTSLTTSSGRVAPLLVNGRENIGDQGFLDAFEDYSAEWNISPRVAFSFPISDEAAFWANYDIITMRPRVGMRLNPFDLLYVEQSGNQINNPNLKPQKDINYEIGFKQKLNATSALSINAFYKEKRDMIQTVGLVGAYPVSVFTFDNIDFGTIKGLTAEYDLRRTGNIQFKFSYTLQFANATGSNSQTAFRLIQIGQSNLRTVMPTDFDQRHRISSVIDYRFADGKNYNGPKLFGKDIFANAGANFTVNAGAGTPYTKRDIISTFVEGRINGSNKPWNYRIDLKIDKTWDIKFSRGEEKGRTGSINAYVDVFNVLNTLGIKGVYTYTGNPDDDGYLSSVKHQQQIEQSNDSESFINYHLMLLNNPGNYFKPRNIRVGVALSF
jgi:outer membrane receptor protein involved in Fe transport